VEREQARANVIRKHTFEGRLPHLAVALGVCVQLACSDDVERPMARRANGGQAGAPVLPSAAASGTSPGVLLPSGMSPPAITGTATGCVPGHYVGEFTGTYNSAAWGNGAVPLSVAAVPSMGRPGLEFWLEQSSNACAPGVEFCADYSVKGGKIRGFANPFSDGDGGDESEEGFAIAIRFEIDFGGELDCSRGQFRGLLQNGCYDVATFLFRFEGTAPAVYDHGTSSFQAGQWMVKELAMPDALFPPDPSIGGMGTWSAGLVMDNAMPMSASTGLCHM